MCDLSPASSSPAVQAAVLAAVPLGVEQQASPRPSPPQQDAPPPHSAALTADEAAKLAALRGAVAGEPPCAYMPLDDACLARYLRARGMDVDKAASMLRNTIAWRHSFGADAIVDRLNLVMEEGATGKAFVAPFLDRTGRTVLVLRPREENTRSHEGNLVHLVYQLERATASMRANGPEKLLLIIDFKGYSMLNAPPMKTSKETLSILQNHYPERLGKAVLLDAPRLFSGAFRALSVFMDPVTREKISFMSTTHEPHIEELEALVDRSCVERDLGGLVDEPHFDAGAYFALANDPVQLRGQVAKQ